MDRPTALARVNRALPLARLLEPFGAYPLFTPAGQTVLIVKHKVWANAKAAAEEAGFQIDAVVTLAQGNLYGIERLFDPTVSTTVPHLVEA